MLGRDDAPELVAASFAVGVFVAFTPLLGLHLVMALGLAVLLKLKKVDVLLGTLLVNPLTLAPVGAVALWIGRLVLPARGGSHGSLPWRDLLSPSFWTQAGPRLRLAGLQWAIGMFVLSLVLGALTYVVLVNVLRARQARRAARHQPSAA